MSQTTSFQLQTKRFLDGAVTGPRRTGGLKFYTYIGPSNHAFTLIGSWAAMALVDLLLPWDARPLFI